MLAIVNYYSLSCHLCLKMGTSKSVCMSLLFYATPIIVGGSLVSIYLIALNIHIVIPAAAFLKYFLRIYATFDSKACSFSVSAPTTYIYNILNNNSCVSQ